MKKENKERARKKKQAALKRSIAVSRVRLACFIAVPCVVVGLFLYFTISGMPRNEEQQTAGAPAEAASDSSAEAAEDGGLYDDYIDESGNIIGFDMQNVSLGITLPLEVDYGELVPADADYDEEVESLLSAHSVLNESSADVIKDGDTVNIDYVGTIGGVEFSGGNTDGNGADLTIGSGAYIDDFEEQLIGHRAGDKLDIIVTFPNNFSDASLAGREAVFATTVNGIYETPGFDDAFVSANLSEYADTAEGYREYFINTKVEENLREYIMQHLSDNVSAEETADAYLDFLMKQKDSEYRSDYTTFNDMYYSMYGMNVWNDVYEYYNMSESEYEAMIKEDAEKELALQLAVLSLYGTDGAAVSDADVEAYMAGEGLVGEDYEDAVAEKGKGYYTYKTIEQKVIDGLVSQAVLLNK